MINEKTHIYQYVSLFWMNWIIFLLTASYLLQVFVVLLVNKQFALKHFNGLMFMYMFIYLCSFVLYNDEN